MKSPRTKKSISQSRRVSIERKSDSLPHGQQTTKQVKKCLTYTNVADFLQQYEIRSYTELLATAEKRKLEGENNIVMLLQDVLSNTEKNICELITKTWLMQSSPAKLERSQASRMEEIERAAAKPCKAGCNWFISALELLLLNGIDSVKFSSAIRTTDDKFGCAGSDKATVMLLQDFRWNKDSIQWKDLLLLLKGKSLSYLHQKNYMSRM